VSTSFTVATAIKAKLAAAVWPGGEKAFGTVLVTAGVNVERTRSMLRWPFCLVLPDSMEVDEEEPDLVTQKFQILIAQSVANDTWGEAVILGGAGPAGGLTSKGRGILELEQILFDTMALLATTDGINIQLISASAISAELDGEIGYVAQRSYTWSAWTGAGSSP